MHVCMYVCNKFYVNPSNGCKDMSLKTTNVNTMVVLERITIVIMSHPLGTMNVCTKLHLKVP